jgi:hypothetical protein
VRSTAGDKVFKPVAFHWLLLTALLASLALAVAVFLNAISTNPYGNWDALAIWNLRAKFLAENDPFWKSAFSPLLSHTHPDYPLLLSSYIARCWRLSGSVGDAVVPVATAALFLFATVGLLVSALAILRGWSAGMLGGLLLLGTVTFLREAPAQYADVPLAFYYLAAMDLVATFDAESQQAGSIAALAGLALGFAAWTKNEGLLFSGFASIAFLALILLTGRPAPAKAVLLLASGAAVPLMIALYFKFFLAPATGTFAQQGFADALHRLIEPGRYSQIIRVLWDEGLGLGGGLAHPVISLAILAGGLGMRPGWRRNPAVIAGLGALVSTACGYFVAYLVTPMDLAWHLANSAGRLYVQLWPSFIFLALLAFRSAEETAIVVEQPKADYARSRSKKYKKARVG